MELYEKTSYELSRHLTRRYSTSFSMSSRLFSRPIQPHIYAIYGLVRCADEIVDTYKGEDAAQQLDELEAQTERAMKVGYSSNPIVHAYGVTARRYNIDTSITRPFFASMRLDLSPKTYTPELYSEYIYGSAEVIGLMCLRVFVDGDSKRYETLTPGARSLGAAYQKVNFLRDMRSDYQALGRVYFPGVSFKTFTKEQKQTIEQDIEQDFRQARRAIAQLPRGAKLALMMSYDYYYSLFKKLKQADVAAISSRRIRISNGHKIMLLLKRIVLR